MKRTIAALALATIFAGTALAACDDAPRDNAKIDEDDRRPGPGDGVDEVGPGR